MKERLIKQLCICILVVLAVLISKNSNIGILTSGADAVLEAASVNYTSDDLINAADTGKNMIINVPMKIEDAIQVIVSNDRFGEPVDDMDENEEAPVYAVGGGQVTAVGENEEIGKYIMINHSGKGDSLYGNLLYVYVQVPQNVTKGQIIATVDKGRNLYYTFKKIN